MRACRPIASILLVLSQPLTGQQLPFHVYSAKDGLIRNAVRSLCQDSTGYIWFGTAGGICRYDGATFSRIGAEHGLPSQFINQIVTSADGITWIATNYAGLAICLHDTLLSYLVDPSDGRSPSNRVNRIVPGRGHTSWLATDSGVFFFDGFRCRRIPISKEEFETGILSFFIDSNDNFWVGNAQGLLMVPRQGMGRPVAIPKFLGHEVYSVIEGPDNAVWVGSDRGLDEIVVPREVVSPRVQPLPSSFGALENQEVRSLLFDLQGNLWIGTGNHGLYKHELDGSLHRYTIDNGLPGNSIFDLLLDREGDLWFATSTGVAKLAADNVLNYTRREGLPDDEVTAVARDGRGGTWFGSHNGLSRLLGGAITNYSTASGLSADYILQLMRDTRGTIWAATASGATHIVASGDRDILTSYGEAQGLTGKPVRSLYQDAKGEIWIGMDGMVAVRRGGRFVEFPVGAGLPSPLVTTMVEDLGGDLWAGVQEGGILQLRPGVNTKGEPVLHEVSRLDERSGIPEGNIRCSTRDVAGNLWFGTRFSGAFRITIRGHHLAGLLHLSTANGLSGDFVRSIRQDASGAMWIGTDRGADRLMPDGQGKPTIRSFSVIDGLAGDEVNDCCQDERGYIWFACTSGATRYGASADAPPNVPPPILITQFRVFGKPDTSNALARRSADLAYDQHSVAFEFIGISFRNETAVRYQYRLEGLEADWSELTDRRYVNYTHLPPGAYVFMVKARSCDGVWSRSPARFTFSIAAPYWTRWWFLAGCLLAVLGLAIAAHRSRLQHLLELERVRSRIAADLHDDLGSTLSSIQIFSEMARQEAQSAAPRAAHLIRRISEGSRLMLEAIDDIVWSINPEHDSLDDTLLRMKVFATEVLEALGVRFTLDVAGHGKLPMDIRRHVYMIFREAITNIARHSHCTEASVQVTAEGNTLTAEITDNGKGFDALKRHDGNGLGNMARRADLIGAELHVRSSPGGGTTVHLRARIT